jgi:hypothetical protein
MLALSDEALQSVMAAAASLPVEQRSAFLQRLAERAELQQAQRVALRMTATSPAGRPEAADRTARPDLRHRQAADRARRYRQRHRNGCVIASLETERRHTEYLADAELLPLDQIEDPRAIGIAIRELIDLLIAAQHLRRHA